MSVSHGSSFPRMYGVEMNYVKISILKITVAKEARAFYVLAQ